MNPKLGFRGYVFSRPINGNSIPQRVQNLVIRMYTQQRGNVDLLSAAEYYMDECYMMLEAMLDELPIIGGIVFYSLEMLPKSREHRLAIYRSVLEHECQLHFALEELVIKDELGVESVEDILMIKSLVHPVEPAWKST